MLASLTSKKWGWKKRSMRKVYTTMQRSVMDYAAASWQPWLSKSQFGKLEKAQNSSLRIMSGQYASTPLEALRLETGIESYETTSKRLTAKAYEKARRLEETHPRYEALNNNAAPHRSKRRSSWRQEAEKINRSLPLADLEREPLPERVQRPWNSSQSFEQWSARWELKEQIKHSQTLVTIFSTHNNQTPWNIDPPGDTKKVVEKL